MNLRLLTASAAALLLAACGGQEQPVAEIAQVDAAEALHALFDEHFERQLEMNPVRATSIGDYRYNDRLANSFSAEYRAAAQAMDEEFLARLLEIDREQLGYQDQLSYDIFRLNREQSLEGNQFPSHLVPVNQFYLFTNFFVQLGSGSGAHPFKSVKDYEDFLSRADQAAVNIDQIIANMKDGMREGVVQPRILMEKVIPQVEAHVVDNVEDSLFYTPVRNMPEDFSDEDRARLTAAYADKIANVIIPAYARLANFVGDEYLAASRETVGLYAQPNGESWYEYMVRLRTTTDMTPEEIHQVGLDEVARIHGEMPRTCSRSSRRPISRCAGSSPSVRNPRPAVPTWPAPRTARARACSMPTPTTSARVLTGPWSRCTCTRQFPGTISRLCCSAKTRSCLASAASAVSRRSPLGKELGVYTDPYQYFGGLNAELWRSIRLVVDTGIHAKGWTRQQVLDYMYENSAVAEARAVSEAERFMAIPGQALAYKVGQLKMLAIRTKAEERLGDKFDVKAFHTQMLMDGAMPLSMLEAKIDRWVDSQL